jgi:SAM-dependent methyltransferase
MTEMNPSQFHSNKKPYNWLIYNNYDHYLKKLSVHYKGTLYDLGCGSAPYKEFFLQYAKKYIGVDWAESLHDTKADVAADLNEPLQIESEVADTVVSLSVMEHLCEPQTMLNEAYRILKRGGVMILHVPWQWWMHEEPYDYFRYTPYGLSYLMKKAGFSNITIHPEGGFFTMWIMKTNYFSLRLIRGPRFLRWILLAMLIPFWYIGQFVAPYFDKLDRHWEIETTGYFVVAFK